MIHSKALKSEIVLSLLLKHCFLPSAEAPVEYDPVARGNFVKAVIMTKIRSTLTDVELLSWGNGVNDSQDRKRSAMSVLATETPQPHAMSHLVWLLLAKQWQNILIFHYKSAQNSDFQGGGIFNVSMSTTKIIVWRKMFCQNFILSRTWRRKWKAWNHWK